MSQLLVVGSSTLLLVGIEQPMAKDAACGTSAAFCELIDQLAAWTNHDLSRGMVPIWHDEFYLNRYLSERHFHLLPPSYAFPEGARVPYAAIITHRRKAHAVIRGESDRGVSVEGILAGDEKALREAYQLMYSKAHEKIQALEDLVRSLRHLPTAFAWHGKRLLPAGLLNAARKGRDALRGRS